MSICDPALRNALRTLKLSGMLDTLAPAWPKPATATWGIWNSCKRCVKTRSPAASPPP